MDKNEENYWLNLEKIFVHHVYENQNDTNQNDLLKQEINGNTNDANKYAYTPWPKVKKFLSRLEPDSLIADIGCGEGKYLNINNKIYSFGCDRSISLCDLAIKNINSKCQILVCDNLALPFRYLSILVKLVDLRLIYYKIFQDLIYLMQ
jgi:SAM-dependent methyltransferase